MKNAKCPHKGLIEDYETELAKVQSHFLKVHSSLKAQIANIEKELAFEDIAQDILKEHSEETDAKSTEPQQHDLEVLYDRLKLAERILKFWNISVHK